MNKSSLLLSINSNKKNIYKKK